MHQLNATQPVWKLKDILAHCEQTVEEIFPWDLQENLEQVTDNPPLLLDVREPAEFKLFHIANAINVPRGILETACEYGFEDSVPSLVEARDREVIVMCRSGKRSVMAAFTLTLMGYQNVKSLKMGVRGWNEDDQVLYDGNNLVMDTDIVEAYLSIPPSAAQLGH